MKFFSSKIKAALAAVVALAGLSSCEKVIDVKLGETDKKVVIDAVLTNEAGDCAVKISSTRNFSDNNDFAGIGGAQVSIKDEAGNSTVLTESSTGIYTHGTLTGDPGKKYTLTVTVNGETFTAASTMPQQTLLDSIYVKTQKFFDEDETFANVVFRDPGGVKNYYRFVQSINGVRTDRNFIMDDDLSDGKLFNSTLYFFVDDDETDKKIKPGDVVTIEMQCLDAAAYKYWFSLDQSATGSSSSAAPSNPVSNMSGGALGYFSAHTAERRSVTAP